jgi:hypothetical protein
MRKERWVGLALAGFSLLCAARAEAHFRLVQPPSWLNEDSLGGPQKGSPCGPGNTMLILGDDVQPVPASNAVTTFSAGQTIVFQLDETVYHPGYFRVSLAHTKAASATTADFPNPPLTDTVNCHYDTQAVRTGAHDNVLADGLFMAEGQEGTNRSLMSSVTLPNEPCEACSLQVVQVMEGHPGSSCFYFHCADIKIVAAPAPSMDLPDAGHTPDAGRLGDGGNPIDLSPVPDASRPGGSLDAASAVAVRSDASTTGARAESGGCTLGRSTAPGFGDSPWFLLVSSTLAVGWRTRRKNLATEKVAICRNVRFALPVRKRS